MRLFFLRVKALFFKELIQALRDPRLLFLIIGPPLLQLLAFGYAANLDLRNIRLAVFDQDHSTLSRELISAFSSSGYFRLQAEATRPEEMNELMDHGRVEAVLHCGPNLMAEVKSGRTALVQVIVAGTNSNTAALVQSYAAQIVERFNRQQLQMRLEQNPRLSLILPAGVKGMVQPEIRVWYNITLTSRNFFVPGIIAMVVMLVVLMLTAMAVVREKEVGTMEQIMATPIRPVEFILGKTLPFALIGTGQTAMVTLMGVLWFGVPMRGSLALLFLALFIYLLSCLSLGLLISTISRTQQQAMMTTFFFFFPAILLSGFIFPIANMPVTIQWVTYLNPLRYFLVIIRSLFLKGAGWDVLWPHLAALLIIGLCLLTLAVRRVHKTLD
jgi:ABC-2 type transport system permease protein